MSPIQITPALLRQWDACWKDWQIATAYAGTESLAPLEIAAREDVCAKHRVWVLLRPQVIGERDTRLVACWAARRVLYRYEAAYPGDLRPRRAIEVAERYARGEASAEELDAACAAARAAARDAACGAARDAACAATWDAGCAARDAAWNAACAAAWDAGCAARDAGCAAWDDVWIAARAAAWDATFRCITAILRDELDTDTPVAEWPAPHRHFGGVARCKDASLGPRTGEHRPSPG